MKPLTEQNLTAYNAAIRRGAIEGAVGGSIIAVSVGWYLNRHWATYRKMPLSLKALGGVIIVAPLLAIQAERRGLQYDRSQWEGLTVDMLDEKQQKSEELWQEMSTKDKFAHWAENHQYSLIFGGWASTLAIAGGIIWRDKYMTSAQKIVQARMWAQGMTIGLLIVAGALTHSRKLAQANHAHPDHSWADILDQHEKERLAAKQLAQAAPTREKVGHYGHKIKITQIDNITQFLRMVLPLPDLEKPLRLPLAKSELDSINAHLSTLTAEEILVWALAYLPDLYQTTAFGLTGLVAIDMLSKLTRSPPPLIFIDTLYHFPETYELVEAVKERYQIPVNVFKPKDCETVKDFESKYGERLWETDENAYDYVVKVEPARRAYDKLKVRSVITGRRASQGGDRADLTPLEVDSTGLLKLNPLFEWNFHSVDGYIKQHQVPRNKLLDQGYKSVGDWHSTVKVGEGQDERAGRWAGQEKTECGLHKDYFLMKDKSRINTPADA